MNKKVTMWLGASVLVVALLVACGASLTAGSMADEVVATNIQSEVTEAAVSTTAATGLLATNRASHEAADDSVWDSASEVPITSHGASIIVGGDGATVDGSIVTITAAGTYSISGVLEDGQVAVDTKDEGLVRLILNGVDIHNATSAAINVVNADKVVIVLADNSENYLSDGESYVFATATDDEPNATLFSKADLTITGNGALSVDANYNDGIASKDGLVIASGTIQVDAVDDGIRGKDYLVVNDGAITVNALGDGLKSDEDEDATKGYIAIEAGAIHVTAGGDALQAETDIIINDGEFVLTTGEGSHGVIAEDASAKGIKAAVAIEILGGTFSINSADDAIHANGTIAIQGGDFAIATGDDGLHADVALVINGGAIAISQSYEGIESAIITINGGTIHLVASDDGINVAGGNDSSGMAGGPRANQDSFTYSGSEYLYVNGGYVVVDAAGDGIDVNGAIEMTDGVVIVNGPTMSMNAALDYDASFTLTGGYLVAAGSSGMAQLPSATSTQPSVLINFDSAQPVGTLVHLQSSDGEVLFTFAPTKDFQSIAFSSPALTNGETYDLYLGGTVIGSAEDGLYQVSDSYSDGSKYTSFTITDVVTTIGQSGRNRR